MKLSDYFTEEFLQERREANRRVLENVMERIEKEPDWEIGMEVFEVPSPLKSL